MSDGIRKSAGGHVSPFERIRRTNEAGGEFWSSRDFAETLGYSDYRNFEAVLEKAKLACFNSGRRVDDHFVDVTEMVRIGSGAARPKNPLCLIIEILHGVYPESFEGFRMTMLCSTVFRQPASRMSRQFNARAKRI